LFAGVTNVELSVRQRLGLISTIEVDGKPTVAFEDGQLREGT
jgi:hypothetical protein